MPSSILLGEPKGSLGNQRSPFCASIISEKWSLCFEKALTHMLWIFEMNKRAISKLPGCQYQPVPTSASSLCFKSYEFLWPSHISTFEANLWMSIFGSAPETDPTEATGIVTLFSVCDLVYPILRRGQYQSWKCDPEFRITKRRSPTIDSKRYHKRYERTLCPKTVVPREIGMPRNLEGPKTADFSTIKFTRIHWKVRTSARIVRLYPDGRSKSKSSNDWDKH
jgi:hypothetical protein